MKLTLTPMDINNKEFKKVMRGYCPEEVDDFLDEVIENYEALYKENASLKEQLSVSSDKIEHYSKIESTIQNTLLLAQNAADQAKTSSEKEAEILVKNANETAQKILDKAHKDVVQINDEYEAVKQEFIKFRAKFRNFINTQLETFNDLEKDVTKSFSIATPLDEAEEDDVYSVPNFADRHETTQVVDEYSEEVYQDDTYDTVDIAQEEVATISFDNIEQDTNEVADIKEEVQYDVTVPDVEEDVQEENVIEEEQKVQEDREQDTIVFDDDSIKLIEDTIGQDEIDEIRSFFASKE